jgi:two-component system sensor histidine kinase YesM
VDPATNSFSRNIYRFEDQKLVGQLVLQVSFSFMDHIVKNLQSNEEESILLLDSKGVQFDTPENDYMIPKAISEEISTQLITSKETKYMTKDQGYYFFQDMMNGQFILLKIVPEEVMMVGAVHIRQTGAAILFISVCLTIILAYSLSI